MLRVELNEHCTNIASESVLFEDVGRVNFLNSRNSIQSHLQSDNIIESTHQMLDPFYAMEKKMI